MKKIEILMGLEIHITLKSKKKIFNWEDTYQGDISPNSKVGPWELGYLGVLPIINPEVILLGLKLALALKMKISRFVLFDRKIYNYFDLPKGYQITQQEIPLATKGIFKIIKESIIEQIPIKSIHLEEDTAKSTYDSKGVKLDFNRAGNPLIELVTKPIFRHISDVLAFVKQLQNFCRYLNISDAKMEKGQLRIDLNFSLKIGENYKTPRYEIKNLNSLSNIEKALNYEIEKHEKIFFQGKKAPDSQTLGFDEDKKNTVVHRKKINYFYLPEANIPVIKISSKEIEKIKKNIPILPWVKWKQLTKIGLDHAKARLIIDKPIILKSIIFLEEKDKL